ncbi:MAG: response regulator, partial [Cyanobacteria bacterium REEB65]|nr:response regulator [Cyanobacteria bacterium REEB65]
QEGASQDQEIFFPTPDRDTGLKVLVVDDDPIFSRAVCRMLATSGYTAARAIRLSRIVPLARSQRLDAVLLDVHLGRFDGLAVCRGIRRHAATKDLPVLLMSGLYCSDDRQVNAASLGVSEVLCKPFTSGDLRDALKRSLAAHAPRKESGPKGRILVVDDDPSWPDVLTHWLKAEGHEIETVSEAASVIQAAKRFQVDCIVLDYILDGCPADSLCARIRAEPGLDRVHVVVHSSHAGAKIRMIEAGADQFVNKSGAPEELLAVLRACLRRARAQEGRSSDGGLVLDYTTHSVCCKGKIAKLSPRLFGLLRLLIEARGAVSRQHILERLPGAATERDHEVDVLVSRLRAVLRKHFGSEPSIETVLGTGYLWVPPADPSR